MPQYYTPAALAALDAKIVVAKRRHDDALLSMGDDSSHETWHDNPAFEQAKQDVDMSREHLRSLRALREEAVIITNEASQHVQVGSTVRVLIDGHDDPTTFHLAGHFVASRSNDDDIFMLAVSAPLGEALLGKQEGDYVTYTTPSGRTIGARIVELIDLP